MADHDSNNASPKVPRSRILIVDDDEAALRAARTTLQSRGLDDIETCADGRQVPSLLEQGNVAVVLLDLKMPEIRGEDVLETITQLDPDLPVIVVTGEDEVESAVHCMQLGAVDYLVKPVDADRLAAKVKRASEQGNLRHDNTQLLREFLEGQLENPEAFKEILTTEPKMRKVFRYIESVATSPDAVLIRGESGTGKELLACALHTCSGRSDPFVDVNVAAFDTELLNTELFGHVEGAFTGAHVAKDGYLTTVKNGTLFLDEIGDLSNECQVKLLRVLQDGVFRRVGDTTDLKFNGRIVAATHRKLSVLRLDFVQRLERHTVEIPPLRERIGDLGVLVEHFLEKAAKRYSKTKPTVPRNLYTYLAQYDWPGNVRELENIVSDAVVQHRGGVMPIALFTDRTSDPRPPTPGTSNADAEKIVFPRKMPTRREILNAAYAEALRRTGNNKKAAAHMLRINRQTLIRYTESWQPIDGNGNESE
jgi:DNA-binding NtrC family response regulator